MQVDLKRKQIRVLAVERRALTKARDVLADYGRCCAALDMPTQSAEVGESSIDMVLDSLCEPVNADGEAVKE
jgi:hypothetical protein